MYFNNLQILLDIKQASRLLGVRPDALSNGMKQDGCPLSAWVAAATGISRRGDIYKIIK